MSFEAKEAFEAANPSARINEYQCWPLHLPDICYPHPNTEAAADVNAIYPTSPPVSLQTRMRSALQVSVQSEIHNQPGIDNHMCPRLTTRIVEEIVCHPSFLKLADDIKTAFDGPWTATTRDLLIRAHADKIPELRGYFLHHMIRSLSYVYKLSDIPCGGTYVNMSGKNGEAILLLEAGNIKPSGIIEYLRVDDELGVVDEVRLPDDDMALELVICQSYGIFKELVQDDKIKVYDFRDRDK